MNKSEIFWQTYLSLEKELLEVSRFIYITDENGDSQLKVYSPHIADLLVRTCIEIEAISKELYFELGGEKTRGDSTIKFDTDCLKLIDMKCQTHKKIVLITCSKFNITKDENISFRPLKEAHKQKGTDWERSYQAVKHDRYSSLSKGTVLSLIHALGALYLLNIYFKDIKLTAKYLEVHKIDYSLGSNIFSVKEPNQKYVIDVINNQEISDVLVADESPFVLKYLDSVYKSVVDANKQNIKARQDYCYSQPEMSDPDFLQIINEGLEKQKQNPKERFIFTWELCKYRLNKKIPASLPFDVRKRLFIETPEWNGKIRNNNPHLSEDELTDDNIQQEIDHAGIQAGMELEMQFDAMKMQKAFNDGYCELVLDKGNIKYK